MMTMMKKNAGQPWKKQLVGRWRIVSMPDFTKADIDEDAPACIEIKGDVFV